MAENRWRETRDDVEPAVWVGQEGHAWRTVRSTRGIEVRPDLVKPFLRYGNAPRITAIGIGDEIEVELTSSSGRWLGTFDLNEIDVERLGVAMIDEAELPHDNLRRLFGPDATG